MSIKKNITISIFAAMFVAANFLFVFANTRAATCPTLKSGDLFKVPNNSAVYLVNKNLERLYFPNAEVYYTWYTDFSVVKEIPLECTDLYPSPSGAPYGVNYRPGSRLVKVKISPSVYVVEPGNKLRKIKSEKIAKELYGDNWAGLVRDIGDSFWPNYTERGEEIVDSVPHSGMFVKTQNSGAVYYVEGNKYKKLDYTPRGDVRIIGQSIFSKLAIAEAEAQVEDIYTHPASGQSSTKSQSADESGSASQPTPKPTPEPTPEPTPTSESAGSIGVTDPNKALMAGNLNFSGLPPAGQLFTDPVFNTQLMRFTEETKNAGGYATHDYSQLQAFSKDNKYILLGTPRGYQVYNADSRLPAALPAQDNINVPRWQSALDHTLLWVDTNEDTTIKVQYANVDTGTITDHYVFPSNYDRIRGNQSFDELSRDGKWMAGMAQMSDGSNTIFTLNLETKKIGAELSLDKLYSTVCSPDPQWGNLEPDWIAASPLGNYLVVNWERDGLERCSGQEVYNIETGIYVGHSYDSHQHGDLGLTTDGKEVFVTVVMSSPEDNNYPAVAYFELPNGANNPRVIKTVPWQAVEHISCRGPKGMCLVTSFAPEADWQYHNVLDKEIYLLFFDGSIRRLTHHRSSGCGYWVQPRASISIDGARFVFDSDFWMHTGGQTSCQKIDEMGGGEVWIGYLSESDLQSPYNSGQYPWAQEASTDGETATEDNTTTQQDTTGDAATGSQNNTQDTSSQTIQTTGSLPETTYTTDSSTVSLRIADPTWFGDVIGPDYVKIAFDHAMGETPVTCSASIDFMKYDWYVSPPNSSEYTKVFEQTGTGETTFYNNSTRETSGECTRETFVYKVNMSSGVNNVAVCISNVNNLEQRYCKVLEVSTQ